MGNGLKGIGFGLLGLAIVIGMISIPVIFIMGAIWASQHLIRPLIAIGWFALALNICVLLPLSLIRRCRGFTGTVIFISSYIFGLITWMISLITVYLLWGAFAVILGLIFLGGGVVPLAVLATLFHGDWTSLGFVIGLLVLTIISRVIGYMLAESYDRQSPQV